MGLDPRIKKSRDQEKRLAKATGGSVSARSGAGWVRKGDVRSGSALWEMKRTDNKRQITLKSDDLETIRKQAWAEGRTPMLGFHLAGRDYVVLEEGDYLELFDE